MSNQLLSSKVVIIEEEPKVRGITATPTSVAGAIGIAERGPVGKPVLCTSFEEYQQVFGGFTKDADLALAAMGFFENGGSHLWIVRIVHFDDVTDPTTLTSKKGKATLTAEGAASPAVITSKTSGPFYLENLSHLVLSVNNEPEAGITFEGFAASVHAGASGPYTLEAEQDLTIRIDDGPEQKIVFKAGDFADITNVTTDQLVAVVNAKIAFGKAMNKDGVLALFSDTEGKSSAIRVTGGTANEILLFPTEKHVGHGTVGNLRQVHPEEIKTLLEGAISSITVSETSEGALKIQTVTTGSKAKLQISKNTASVFGFDNNVHKGSDKSTVDLLRIEGKDFGAYANRFQVKVQEPILDEKNTFDMAVVEDGTYREVFSNLSMNPQDPRYIETIINNEQNGSSYIRVIDAKVPNAPLPSLQTQKLTGGADGLAGLDDNDFIGSDGGKTGIHALDTIQELSLLLVPGRATPAVHNAMIRYCKQVRRGMVFAVLDPPAGQKATEIIHYVTQTAKLENLTEYAAIYWPRLKVLNPAKRIFGAAKQIIVQPSGIICGVYARTDAARPGGIYDPPAGIEKGRLLGVLGFETDEVLEERKRDLIYPKRINPLTTGPGLPNFIDGSRTLKGDGNFPYIAERRGVIFIERSIKQGLQFARHKNNTESLRAQVRRTITAFLLTQMNNGAFRSREPDKAFFVDVSETLNPLSVVMAGKLNVRIGLATNKPAEYIVVMISQDVRALQTELSEAGA